MYYYIFQSTTDRKTSKIYDKIKLKIGLLGIAGETVQTNPIRTVEELTEVGMAKGYSTIVAVGDDEFINKVAHFLINLSLAQDKNKIVMGALPIQPQQSQIAKIIKVANLDEAIEGLRNRHLQTFDAAFIEPNKFFISPIEISKSQPFYTVITAPRFFIKSIVKKIQINPSLICRVQDVKNQSSFLNRFFSGVSSIWGENDSPASGFSTRFRAHTISIESNELIPVRLGQEIIAKTPIKLHVIPQLLQLITPRAKIATRSLSQSHQPKIQSRKQ